MDVDSLAETVATSLGASFRLSTFLDNSRVEAHATHHVRRFILRQSFSRYEDSVIQYQPSTGQCWSPRTHPESVKWSRLFASFQKLEP